MSELNDELLYEYLVNGDLQAFENLFVNNLKLVRFVIKKHHYTEVFSDNYYLYEDYYSAGCFGLARAIKSFDKDKIGKIKFSTYAAKGINLAIITESRVFKKSSNVYLLSEPINEAGTSDGDELIALEETLADDFNNSEKYDEEIYNEYKKKSVLRALDNLKEKDKKIIEMYYGFKGEKYTHQQIADSLNISRSYVIYLIGVINKRLMFDLMEFKDEYDPNNEDRYKKVLFIKRMNEAFYSLFGNYSEEEIKNRFKVSSSLANKVISLYYGLDGENCLDYDEIADRYEISVDEVDRLINEGIDRLKKFLKRNKR